MGKKLLIVLSLVFFACNPDDESEIADAVLEGEWVLTQVSCFCGFEPETDFTLTRILFDTDNDKITVIQNGENTFSGKRANITMEGKVIELVLPMTRCTVLKLTGRYLPLPFRTILK